MAQPAIAAVRSGATTFVPKNWEKTYFEWMENIQPWCISRQLWWGHQIPAWYGFPTPQGVQPEVLAAVRKGLSSELYTTFVAENEAAAIKDAESQYGCRIKIVQNAREAFELQQETEGRQRGIWRDEDVLDTWFSSALWPFSTLGWPDDETDVDRYYPTNVLVTGWDIIFFWVARMMMMGLHFKKEAPFSTVYIHRLVRDQKGAKMSKSKGNVIDPLGVIDEYGADALRFALARGATHSHDIKLSSQLVETNRNFVTKLWNAARFVEFNGAERAIDFDPGTTKEMINGWIIRETAKAVRGVTSAIIDYRFNEAADAAYHFVWDVFCDWYVELSKPILTGLDAAAKYETGATAAWVLDEILKLLHPFMPFATEELWRVTGERGPRREQLLALSRWSDLSRYDTATELTEPTADIVVQAISEARTIRTELSITPKNTASIEFRNFNQANTVALASTSSSIARLLSTTVKIVYPTGETIVTTPPPRPGEITAASEGMPSASPFAPTIGPATITVGSESLGAGTAISVTKLDDFNVRSPVKEGMITINVPAFDVNKERVRLTKELEKADADIKRVDAKLSNEKFVANAPEELVEEEKEKREAAVERKTRILEALERLKNAV
jgi:valyl-tRNA synthetase